MDIPPVSLPAQPDPCLQDLYNNAAFNAQTLYNQYIDSLRQVFYAQYKKVCRKVKENLTLDWEVPGNYWTVYQYDEAGNLLQTVPPGGVTLLTPAQITQVQAYRNGTSTTPVYPAHSLTTDYRYNTQNLVTRQRTPDGGTSRFYYDKAFRLAASQNDRQQADMLFSYTRYDYKGRAIESGVGKATGNTPPSKNILSSTQHPDSWLSDKREVVKTLYDQPYDNNSWQEHLRNRVSAVERDEDNDGQPEQAYLYSYDILGNVNQMRSYTHALKPYGHQWKRMLYEYDLISGKVTRVTYQPNQADQLIHRYTYDADNRLLGAWTSRDGWYWEQDAHYSYYLHGPLKRAVIGQRQVQGLDYVYTLNGWMKGLNNAVLDSTKDAGGDGMLGGLNQYVAKDKLAFQLQYFHGDYAPIGNFVPGNFTTFTGLFNGNIPATMIAQDTLTPLTAAYRYDALNRLRQKSTFKNYQNVLSYSTSYTYDKMGNILTLNRFASNAPMDSLRYHYYANSNQLEYVNDAVAAGAFSNDIDNQNPNNYAYDPTGNLIKDHSEGLEIKWTHYGKVKNVNKNNAPLLAFEYDATGNRSIKDNRQTNEKQIYIRDAQGNVMAIYKDRNDSLFLDELHLYGSNRLGVIKANEWLPKKDDNLTNVPPVTLKASLYTLKLYNFGKKRYELADWLGNVRVVINDKKTPQGTNASDMTYAAQVLEVNDYYPFGMLSRSYSGGGYRYGFNGKEQDNEIIGEGRWQDYGARMYRPDLGRFFSPDPLIVYQKKYPELSSYQFVSNSPIQAIDLDGLEPNYMIDKFGKLTKPILSLFNAAYAFDQATMQSSTWSYYKNSQFGEFWFWMTQYPTASVAGTNVYHDAKHLGDGGWLGLIAHEESHRQDINMKGTWDFYVGYLLEGVRKSYRQISTEVKAYKYGSDSYKTDLTDKLLSYKGGKVLNILKDPNLSTAEKSSQLRIVGLQFRLDEIINPALSNINQSITDVTNQLKTADENTYQGLQSQLNMLQLAKQLLETEKNQIQNELSGDTQ